VFTSESGSMLVRTVVRGDFERLCYIYHILLPASVVAAGSSIVVCPSPSSLRSEDPLPKARRVSER
jgi:hypothetical protein